MQNLFPLIGPVKYAELLRCPRGQYPNTGKIHIALLRYKEYYGVMPHQQPVYQEAHPDFIPNPILTDRELIQTVAYLKAVWQVVKHQIMLWRLTIRDQDEVITSVEALIAGRSEGVSRLLALYL